MDTGNFPGQELDQGAPRRMFQEVSSLEILSRELIRTLRKCSVPSDFRHCTGSQIRGLIQQIQNVSQNIKCIEPDVNQHQESTFG